MIPVKVERWELIGVGTLLLVALVARVVGLNASLWYDEILTLTRFVRLPWPQLLTDFSSFNNHMFYSLQAKAAVSLFGESAWALRLPALAFGLGSLPLIWWMARQAAGRVVALLTLGLVAISYHHVWFTQNARGYTGLLFWTTAATLLMIEGLKRPRWGVWLAYGACLAAGMYTHLSAAFFFVAHGVVFAVLVLASLLKPGGPVARAYPGAWSLQSFGGYAFGALATLALHAPLFSQVLGAMGKMKQGSEGSSMAEWNNPLRTLQEVVGSVDGLGPLAPIALLGGLVLIVVGAVQAARRAPVLAGVYLLSVPLGLAILKALSFRIWPRYFFVDIGFLFLCVALGAFTLAGWAAGLLEQRTPLKRTGPVLIACAVVVMAGASMALLLRNYAHPKQDFTGAIALVESRRAAGDVATSTGLAGEPLHEYFRPSWPVVESGQDLERMLSGGHTVWLIVAFRDHTRTTKADVMKLVDARFEEVAELPGTMGGGYLHVYRSRPAPASAPAREAQDGAA
jgi:mannosyltransferase